MRIIKYETGTEIPISGARFEVVGPDGDSVGTFVTNGDGRIEIPLSKSGNYTVIEREAPQHYMISEEPAQNVTVVYDEVAEVTFFNDPYGTLRIEKKSNTGMNLPGAVITVEHIESGLARPLQSLSLTRSYRDCGSSSMIEKIWSPCPMSPSPSIGTANF